MSDVMSLLCLFWMLSARKRILFGGGLNIGVSNSRPEHHIEVLKPRIVSMYTHFICSMYIMMIIHAISIRCARLFVYCFL